jgi:hypothetical protein
MDRLENSDQERQERREAGSAGRGCPGAMLPPERPAIDFRLSM